MKNRSPKNRSPSIERIYLQEGELAKLIGRTGPSGEMVSASFGPGWVALEFDPAAPVPWDVLELAEIRGVLNENCEGAGI